MPREIPKAYEPQLIERRWAKKWAEEDLFRADVNAPGPVFSIVIPPPNVTGSLHIGHMLDHTEIDTLTRWRRMQGYNTLYLPGTDHAGISTQRVVVRQLAAQGINYRDLGREAFERKVWEWKAESGGTITRQMVQLGESCDWTRERFTLSPELSRAVTEVFVRLYEDGLIYRGHYIVNWCPQCRTAISDLETVHEERQGHLWHIRYPIVGTNEYVVVATTRPETMLGDTAVAVHPSDPRYQHLIGKMVLLPLVNREIPIVDDFVVDRDFGTGAVKVTPAHDPNDFEIGRRHHLPEIDVMTDDAKMSAAAGPYAGLDRFEARNRVVADLESAGLLEKVTDHTHAVGTCDRCGTIIEPRASTQWFVKMKPLAEPAIVAVERGDVEIVPDNRRTEYFEWMRNIRDWCISRQLWWGHRIPAWYCGDCKEIIVARQVPSKCTKCPSSKLTQDPDVLETWFSSALWPFSTMGWPDDTPDYRKYYPTSLLITGYDILFFWVARMIMMGLKFTGQVPFRQVCLHSLVRNAEGQKMSKSKGTGIDPVALNERFGTDAMRFTLLSMAAPGTDIVLSEERILSYRAFANKIWNAARFVFMNLDKYETAGGETLEALASPDVRASAPYAAGGEVALIDRWIFSRLARATAQVNDALEHFRFHEAAHVLYHFFWGDFCDWYIEWVKPELLSPDRSKSAATWKNFFAAFESALRLLHPFMPFLTEELWQQLPQSEGARSIALDRFPEPHAEWIEDNSEERVALIQDLISAARNIRAEMKLDMKAKMQPQIRVQSDAVRTYIEQNIDAIERLANLSPPSFVDESFDSTKGIIQSCSGLELFVAYKSAFDVTARASQIRKERERLSKDIDSKRQRLADDTFRSRAPEHIVKGLEATLAERVTEFNKLGDQLAQLEGL
ncbi:MAG TPA: valine--tRNA ligase [Candidatus Acidoferrales bacterium]|jgi:valyl-tRNA synthetase|nr:valine--tRNA ligase [Candidatus Acidoferrales bacterium]